MAKPELGGITRGQGAAHWRNKGVIENQNDGSPVDHEALATELDKVIHRSLLQLGAMRAIRDGVRCVSERLSKIARPLRRKPTEG